MVDVNKYEILLKGVSCDIERISILEKKSLSRFQILKRSKQIYIQSLNDRYKHMRIVLLALIIHIHNYRDTQRIHKFKSIVYQSQLKQLVASKGLIK